MPQSSTTTKPSLPALAGGGFVLVLGLKLYFASVLDLYSDEIFYWLASTRPALAYSDLPFVTALLAGLGSSLAAGEALAVRTFFLILGSSIPLLVHWIARPLLPGRQALEAAAASLCVPLGGFLGLLAVPDVPLIFFGLLAIGFFQRALEHDYWSYWLATGLFVALGLCTHYRFLLYVAAAGLFLLCFKREHRQWRNPRFWAAAAVGSLGLLPVVWFNLSHDLSSASFYFVERHPWEFQATGLLHLFKQAILVTPLLYGLLIYTALYLWRQARQGHRDAALLLSFALVNLAVYWLLAPWTDADSTSIHWPLSGYFPLLVFLPAAMRQLGERWPWRREHYRMLLIAGFSLGFTGTLLAFIGVGSQAYQLPLQRLLGSGVLSNKMAGWEEYASHSRELIARRFTGQEPVIITDNYYTAAQTLFAGLADAVYTLDQDKAVRDGRITQLQLWQMHTADLAGETGNPALYINEDSTLEVMDKRALMDVMCRHADNLNYVEDLVLFNGDKRFSYYWTDSINSDATSRARPCPYPMRAWLDTPAAAATVSGTLRVSGWAYSEDAGIDRVLLVVDGQVVQQMQYGVSRQDVVDVMSAQLDPNAPDLGFEAMLDSSTLDNGSHELAIELHNGSGEVRRYGQRQIQVNN